MLSKYFSLHVRLAFLLIRKRKISVFKLINFFVLKFYRFFKIVSFKNGPIMVNFELWNECNEACLFCRSQSGLIYRADSETGEVQKGKARYEDIAAVVSTFKKSLIVCVPYVNGEPLISPILPAVLDLLKTQKIASVIASNGISLSSKNARQLLDNDLDLLKVHISGVSKEIHQIQHRTGDPEKILKNLSNFQNENRRRGSPVIVVLDYILYNHNRHELSQAKAFCSENGILLNVRPGNNKGLEETEVSNIKVDLSNLNKVPCDYVWEAFTLDWNKRVLPCCDFVTWVDQPALVEDISSPAIDIQEEWRNGSFADFRAQLRDSGRNSNPVCRDCPKVGLGFKF